MIVTVKYQGIIADMLERKSEQVTLPDGASIDDLFAKLTDQNDLAETILKQTRAFVDGKQADRAAPLADDAEVIFMRPIAGGGVRISGSQGDRENVRPDTPSP